MNSNNWRRCQKPWRANKGGRSSVPRQGVLERPTRLISTIPAVLPPKKRTRNSRFSLPCYRRDRVTLSPEPPGIFRFGLAPAGAGPWAGGPPGGDHACRLQGCIGARVYLLLFHGLSHFTLRLRVRQIGGGSPLQFLCTLFSVMFGCCPHKLPTDDRRIWAH